MHVLFASAGGGSMGRVGAAIEIANAAVFLASDDSRFVKELNCS
ncbi:hypothetical protein RK21_02025 [Pseudomonas plecoglossicida]|nr:hypothetical protein RK21_02025 [Pseudomonas plecoglossicida]